MVTNATLTLSDSFLRGLACASLSPGLRSILLFDVSPAVLRFAAEAIAPMLTIVTGQQVRQVTLGTTEAEDDLWGQLTLRQRQSPTFEWQPGLLTCEQELRFVVIPDLSQLSLSAARACVALMGAEVAHLERQGQHHEWRPNLCWLAGCATQTVGTVSLHLLDRFALRLTGKLAEPPDPVNTLMARLDQSSEESPALLTAETEDQIRAALQCHPQVTQAAIARSLDYFSTTEPRREIALIRLAIASARLDQLPCVDAAQIDLAAQMIGLKPAIRSSELPSDQPIETAKSEKPKAEQSLDVKPAEPTVVEEEARSLIQEPVYESDAPETFEPEPISFNSPANPYPEDVEPAQRESASLQLPLRRFQTTRIARGAIVGVEPATTPQDLAWVSTLLEAAKWQRIRRQQPIQTNFDSSALIVLSTDLRRYRRLPVAEQMLVLVMDHTCLRDCNWRETVFPYLSWAYVERASVCLVQVGAAIQGKQSILPTKSTSGVLPEELRAKKTIDRSILVPRIRVGIEAERGRATPLAHGLDLALQTLRHALQHGRSTIQQAILVIVSDGRGNVPLAASRSGQITPPVNRQGVDDALQVAQSIRKLDNVNAVLLNPQPRQYPDLPLELAKALGAKVVMISPLESWEVEP